MRTIWASNNLRLLAQSSMCGDRPIGTLGVIDDRIRIHHFSLWFVDRQYINFHQCDNLHLHFTVCIHQQIEYLSNSSMYAWNMDCLFSSSCLPSSVKPYDFGCHFTYAVMCTFPLMPLPPCNNFIIHTFISRAHWWCRCGEWTNRFQYTSHIMWFISCWCFSSLLPLLTFLTVGVGAASPLVAFSTTLNRLENEKNACGSNNWQKTTSCQSSLRLNMFFSCILSKIQIEYIEFDENRKEEKE